MAIMASDSGGGDYQPVPQGTYDAICYKIVDAGTSMNKFQDEVNKQHSIFIFWELPSCRTEDDRPMSIFHKYRLSLRENAKLRSHLQSWRNKPFTEKELAGFDITKILGVTCKLTVGLTSGGKEKVTGVFCADGGPKKTATENEQVIFDLEDYIKEFSGESCEASKKACSGRLLVAMSRAKNRYRHASRCRQHLPRVARNQRKKKSWSKTISKTTYPSRSDYG